jgi:Mg-chelatase subunit ChlD
MNFQAYTLPTHNDWACIQVKPNDFEARTPVHLCCIIDTSASMNTHNKLNNVKKSLQFLLDFLTPQDSISIITFSDKAHTILSQTSVTSTEKENIRTRISFIKTESNTNLSAGIIQAHECLLQTNTNNIKQGILLLTDGVANCGLILPQDILKLIRNTVHKFNTTSISSIGYGTDHNIELLQNISTESGGSYYVVNNLEDVATVFGNILGGLISCSAQQVRVILPIDTEIKSRYITNIVNNQLEVVIGDLPTGTESIFLAKIPTGSSITIKGYDLSSHNLFELNTHVNTTDNETLHINSEAHYIRFEVLTLLEQSQTLMNWNSTIDNINAHIAKIDEFIVIITNYRVTHEHTLWNILVNELNICKQSLLNRNQYNVDTPHILSQRTGYLGRMRGLPATIRSFDRRDNDTISYDDPESISTPRLSEPVFSNYTQRQISSQLYASVISTTSEILNQENDSQSYSPLEILPQSSFNTNFDITTPNIARQITCAIPLSRSSSD